MQQLMGDAFEHWHSCDTFPANESVAKLMWSISVAFLLGHDERLLTDEIRNLFFDFFNGQFAVLYLDIPGLKYYKSKRAFQKILPLMYDLIRRRRAVLAEVQKRRANSDEQKEDTPTEWNDLLSTILEENEEKGRPLSDDYIAKTVAVVAFAGFDTSRGSFLAILNCMIDNPEHVDRMRAEAIGVTGSKDGTMNIEQLTQMTFVDKFLDEVFRYNPTFQIGSMRRPLKTLEVGDYQIPKGWDVLISSSFIRQNDPNIEHPGKFDPDRTQVVPRGGDVFGHGKYSCAGKQFAILNRKVFTVMLARNFIVRAADPLKKRAHTYDYFAFTFKPEVHLRLERVK